MKKSILILFVIPLIVSCGDVYEEGDGSVFDGVWTQTESHFYYTPDSTVRTYNSENMRGRFIISRKFEGEDLLLFYSGGTYDSSFFYRIQDQNLFVRRIKDVDTVKISGRDPDNNNNEIIITDTMPLKPLKPNTDYSPEKYYGTFEFIDGAELSMEIIRYETDAKGAPTNKILYRDLYVRPDND